MAKKKNIVERGGDNHEEPKEKKAQGQVIAGVELHPALKYKGPGSLGRTWEFEGIAGSIAATDLKEAVEKANEIATKHPSLLVK